MVRSRDVTAAVMELTVARVDNCMKCGKCSASCPVSGNMDFMPHEFVAKIGKNDAASLVGCDAIWQCLSCFACVERCPRDVKPAHAVDAVKQYAMRQKKHMSKEPDIEVSENMPQQLLVALGRKFGKENRP